MRKISWIGILGIVTLIGNASAQVPSECESYAYPYGACGFACQAGDFIEVSGKQTEHARHLCRRRRVLERRSEADEHLAPNQ